VQATGYIPLVTEQHDVVPNPPRGAGELGGPPGGFMPPTGDPSLELFTHDWSPNPGSEAGSETYQGRHRAPDA